MPEDAQIPPVEHAPLNPSATPRPEAQEKPKDPLRPLIDAALQVHPVLSAAQADRNERKRFEIDFRANTSSEGADSDLGQLSLRLLIEPTFASDDPVGKLDEILKQREEYSVSTGGTPVKDPSAEAYKGILSQRQKRMTEASQRHVARGSDGQPQAKATIERTATSGHTELVRVDFLEDPNEGAPDTVKTKRSYYYIEGVNDSFRPANDENPSYLVAKKAAPSMTSIAEGILPDPDQEYVAIGLLTDVLQQAGDKPLFDYLSSQGYTDIQRIY